MVDLHDLLLGFNDEDGEKIKRAYHFAEENHRGQQRKVTNDPYIIHPYRAAIIAKETGDPEIVIASLLHDVVEDTNVTLSDVKRLFGKSVAFLVDGCTKETDRSALEKLRDYTRVDQRVLVVKLADRIDNMSDNLDKMPEKTPRKYVVEGKEIIKLCEELQITFQLTKIKELVGDLVQNQEICHE